MMCYSKSIAILATLPPTTMVPSFSRPRLPPSSRQPQPPWPLTASRGLISCRKLLVQDLGTLWAVLQSYPQSEKKLFFSIPWRSSLALIVVFRLLLNGLWQNLNAFFFFLSFCKCYSPRCFEIAAL